MRHDDYESRHISPPPPDYYLAPGEKYANRFTNELRPKLTHSGQAWVDRTFRLLQEAIENRRDTDPKEFDQLEQDADGFRSFAYETHPRAYLDGGLHELPVVDLAKIAITPDPGDLGTIDGVRQIFVTAGELTPQWVDDAERAAGRKVEEIEGAAGRRIEEIEDIIHRLVTYRNWRGF